MFQKLQLLCVALDGTIPGNYSYTVLFLTVFGSNSQQLIAHVHQIYIY